jgi:hypothetical protein
MPFGACSDVNAAADWAGTASMAHLHSTCPTDRGNRSIEDLTGLGMGACWQAVMVDATVSDRTAGVGTLADRLRQARAESFIGRRGELELFRTAIESQSPPFTVLHVHGPGGVGNTTLLYAYAAAVEAAGRYPLLVDARAFEPSPAGFLDAVGVASGNSAVPAPVDDGRLVLLIDTYESAAPIDDWLREHFLPGLRTGLRRPLGPHRSSSRARHDPASRGRRVGSAGPALARLSAGGVRRFPRRPRRPSRLSGHSHPHKRDR